MRGGATRGTTGTISYNAAGAGTNTLTFEPAGTTRFGRTKLWDLSLNKTFTFRGGQNRIKATIDGFNVLNTATVLSYSSQNLSSLGTAQNPIIPAERISSIIPPRVFRAGLTFWF